MWKDRKTGELVYITQPNSTFDEEEMAEFCKEYGLTFRIDPSISWHYPLSTTAIIVTRDVKVADLAGCR
jgi:hypothetical protein